MATNVYVTHKAWTTEVTKKISWWHPAPDTWFLDKLMRHKQRTCTSAGTLLNVKHLLWQEPLSNCQVALDQTHCLHRTTFMFTCRLQHSTTICNDCWKQTINFLSNSERNCGHTVRTPVKHLHSIIFSTSWSTLTAMVTKWSLNIYIIPFMCAGFAAIKNKTKKLCEEIVI